MIDLEEQLRAALRVYADGMESSTPTMAVLPAASQRDGINAKRWLAIGAAVSLLLVAAGSVLVLKHGQRIVPQDRLNESWSVASRMPLKARREPNILWTGSEFLVWGGSSGTSGLSDGALYDPTSDGWRFIAANAHVRPGSVAVWTGDEMVVPSDSGAEAYNPSTDRWTALPDLIPSVAGATFTDVVWSGQTLLGVEIRQNNDGGQSSTASVWELDDSRESWEASSPVLDLGFDVPSRGPFTSDSFHSHEIVTTDDGFALWDGELLGWRYSLTDGWSRLPAMASYDGDVLITNTELVWADDSLITIAVGRTAIQDDTRLSRLTDRGWSAWEPVYDRSVLGASYEPAGGLLMTFGLGASPHNDPLLIDIVDATARVAVDSPLEAVIEQGVGWSGKQLLICGGQTPNSDSSEQTTDGPTPLSEQCVLWSP